MHFFHLSYKNDSNTFESTVRMDCAYILLIDFRKSYEICHLSEFLRKYFYRTAYRTVTPTLLILIVIILESSQTGNARLHRYYEIYLCNYMCIFRFPYKKEK